MERLAKTINQIEKEVSALTIPNEVELIVIDNASTDGTRNYLKNINKSNLKVIRNSTNQGMLGNLNVFALRSKLDYVWCLGNDDFLIPGALELVLKKVRNSKLPIIYLNYSHALPEKSLNGYPPFEPVATRVKNGRVHTSRSSAGE